MQIRFWDQILVHLAEEICSSCKNDPGENWLHVQRSPSATMDILFRDWWRK